MDFYSYQYAYFLDVVKERAKGKITRCAKKSHYSIYISNLWNMQQHAFELTQQSIAAFVGKYIWMDGIFFHA